jgi:hypothetical protein
MTTNRISVSEFKAHCTALLREMRAKPQRWQITNRGKVIAEVGPPAAAEIPDPKQWLGSLRGTVTYHPGWDQPEDPDQWEANR